MKSLKIFVTSLLLATGLCASAQSKTTSPNEWQTGYFQWNPSSFEPDQGDNQSFTGLSLGWSKAIQVAASSPWHIEAGAALQYSFYSEDGGGIEEKFNMFSVKVPIHVLYMFKLNNSNIEILPYAGLNVRYNISGTVKYTWDDDYDDDDYDYWAKTRAYDDDYDDGGSYKANLFDKKDMGGSKYTWKRLQLGWEIGVKARFNGKYLVGLSYGSDFGEIAKDTKVHTTSITLGYCF